MAEGSGEQGTQSNGDKPPSSQLSDAGHGKVSVTRAKHSAKYDSELTPAVGANITPILQRRKLRLQGGWHLPKNTVRQQRHPDRTWIFMTPGLPLPISISTVSDGPVVTFTTVIPTQAHPDSDLNPALPGPRPPHKSGFLPDPF